MENREIKFRGLNRSSKKWCYGYVVVDEKYCQIWQEGDVPVIVDPETVGEYTGLKDKNGKEIYEGDIVNIKSTYSTDTPVDCNATVLFRDGRFTTDYHDLQVCGFTRAGNWEGEVIGNIYENPELLKKEE